MKSPVIPLLLLLLVVLDYYVRQKKNKTIQSLSVDELLTELKSHDLFTRQTTAAELGKRGGYLAVEPLIRMFEQERYVSLRAAAIEALGEIGNAQAIEVLIYALGDDNTQIQKKTEEILQGKSSQPQVVETFIQALGSKDREIRRKAAEYVKNMPHDHIIEPLIQALEDQNVNIRRNAARLLGESGDLRALEPLGQTLSDKSPFVRRRVVEALGKLGDARAIEPLIKSLEDADEDVRQRAAEILAKLDWKPDDKIALTYYLLASRAWSIIVDLGVSAIAPLQHILKSAHPNLQQEATEVLRRIYATVEVVLFGAGANQELNPRTTLCNPDVTELTMPMPQLARVLIYTNTYDFLLVERFITYAVNYLGQDYLKKHVEVQLYGKPENLHENLLNNFKHLCKRLRVDE